MKSSIATALFGVLFSLVVASPVGAVVHAGDQTALDVSHLHLRLSSTQVVVGKQVIVTVVVTPRSQGRLITLQRRGKRGWRSLAIKSTNSAGKVLFRLKNPAVTSERIGAVVAPLVTATAARAQSAVLDVVPVAPAYAGHSLAPGATGTLVTDLQQRLQSLGYWMGGPNGSFGDATEQAVYALQKAAGIAPNGIVGASTVTALQDGVLPTPHSHSGYVIEIDLKRDLVMFVNNGTVEHVLNTSTGGGYTYTQDGVSSVAITPTGSFKINRVVDGLVVDSLGALWRPRFFYEGFAIHGDSYVPPVPVSHGCARVSNAAIDWIWSANLAPVGTTVSVYG